MDLNMPVMDGFQSTKCIRTMILDNTVVKMNIVTITADSMDARLKQKCKSIGFNELLENQSRKKTLFKILKKYYL